MNLAQISPNPRKTKVQIDIDGNEVVPFTNKVVKLAEENVYIPTKAERESAAARVPPTAEELAQARREIRDGILVPTKTKQKKTKTGGNPTSLSNNPFAGVFKDMLQEQMKQGLAEALGGLDLKGMMAEVLEDAFKK